MSLPLSYGSKRAFTLVEILVGVFVMALLALTLLPSYLFANRQVSFGRRMDQATQLAASELESWRKKGFDELPDVEEGKSSVTLPIADVGDLPNAKGVVTFTLVDDKLQPSADAESDRVLGTATVTWKEGDTPAKKVTVTTLYSAN